jgi:hypothetical protein
MKALFNPITALALCAACSGGATEDEVSASPAPTSSSALEADGAAGGGAAPLPITEEELERLLDALEQEMGRRK